MAEEPASLMLEKQPKPEMAHVLFTDVVGYSKLPSDEQPRLIQRLRQAVRNSVEYNRAHNDHSLICLPTGDGMALVFFESDVCAPVRAAIEISAALHAGSSIAVRMGLHTGLVYRVPDINGAENVSGAGINFAQRVMDCGDAGHILMSQVHASFLCEFDTLRPHLHDLGEAEVKHGVRLQLVNYFDGTAGRASPPAKLSGFRTAASRPTDEKAPVSCAGAKVAVIYKRNVEPDETLLLSLEAELTRRGCEVFIDRHMHVGLNWAREIERALRAADAVIPLLSPRAVMSEMLAFELEIADAARQQQGGHPRLLPVRVNWEGPLPENLNTILNSIQYVLWRGPEDTATVVAELTAAVAEPAPGPIPATRALEPPGGAMPLDSQYYVERPTDAEFHTAIARRDSIVLVEGARQMGKTSLLSRGLQRARASGAKVTCTDFQKLNASDLTSLESFFITLGTTLATQLDLEKFPEDTWRPKSGPNQNFENYFRREVLGRMRGPLIWALDEVDRLFTCPFGSEVFGLFRSWHNARALDPESPWHGLTMVICYATEAHLFITDLNQSPFNVGTRVRLHDFGPTEMRQLNELYGEPLAGPVEYERFVRLLGGQPYLVRRGLHEMVVHRISLAELERLAATEEGPFADHLKRYLVLLSGNDSALQFLRTILSGKQSSDAKLFYRLRAAGLLCGESPVNAAFRCELYAQYLRRHLA
jgi:class 3 adenylate cyclase